MLILRRLAGLLVLPFYPVVWLATEENHAVVWKVWRQLFWDKEKC